MIVPRFRYVKLAGSRTPGARAEPAVAAEIAAIPRRNVLRSTDFIGTLVVRASGCTPAPVSPPGRRLVRDYVGTIAGGVGGMPRPMGGLPEIA